MVKKKNHLYQNVQIIDDSKNVESADTNIESRMEHTVVFPGTKIVFLQRTGVA
jgi:hypothetical protein